MYKCASLQICLLSINSVPSLTELLVNEKCLKKLKKDPKGVVRSGKSKEDRQYSGQ